MVTRGAALEDTSLVRAAVAGDDDAFTRLYQSYSRSIFNMILRSVRDAQLAEDVSQDVWFKAHRQLGKLRDPGAFPTWLYRIAGKACIDLARRRGRRIEEGPLEVEICGNSGDPELSLIARDDAQRVWEALAALPAHQHLALFLREVEHRPYREIAKVLGVSETAAGLCLLRARRSFAATYSRVHECGAVGRCAAMRRVIALSIDGLSTVVQDHALGVHLRDCAECRREMSALRRTSQQYAGLVLLPVPTLLHSRILSSALPGKAVATSALGKLTATIVAHIKVAAITAGIVGGAVIAPQVFEGVTNGDSHAASVFPTDSIGSPARAPFIHDQPAGASLGGNPASPVSADGPGTAVVDDVTSLLPDVVQAAEDTGGNADALFNDVLNATDTSVGSVLEPLSPFDELASSDLSPDPPPLPLTSVP